MMMIFMLPPSASSLAPVKSRMETFWYRLTQVVLENDHKTSVVVLAISISQQNP